MTNSMPRNNNNNIKHTQGDFGLR